MRGSRLRTGAPARQEVQPLDHFPEWFNQLAPNVLVGAAMKRWSLSIFVVATGAFSAWPAKAWAAEGVTYLSPGAIVSLSPTRVGFGTELSLAHHPHDDQLSARGAYVQMEWAADVDERTPEAAHSTVFHVSVGPEWSWLFFGLEAGVDYRGRASSAQGRSAGVRVAPYVSLGVVYVATSLAWLPLRIDDDAYRAQGFVGAITIGAKLPIVLSGQLVAKDLCPHC